MARIARGIAPGIPHHIVQRVNCRQDVFLKEDDQRAYLNILREQADKNRLSIYAYCLMTNHIHIIASNDLLAKLIDDWQTYLTITATEAERFKLKHHERTGRPLGDTSFVEHGTIGRTAEPYPETAETWPQIPVEA